MEPATIAAQLRELALYYELDGDRHRAFAYERAAAAAGAANGLARLIDEGRLEELPGIGPSTAKVITELARAGSVPVLDRMRATWPPVVLELAQLRGVGVLKARAIYQAFSPPDLEAVADLARAGALRELPKFGQVSERKVLEAIEERRAQGARILLLDAEPHAESLAAHVFADPAALEVLSCGPVRRWLEIVDRVAIAVATHDRDAVIARFASYPLASAVDRSGWPITAQLPGGLRAELYPAAPAQLGWAQLVATGSPEHVALLRARATDRGVDLDTLDAPDEAAVYAALGLPLLPPEVRDGSDELAAADAGDDFGDLVALADVTAAFHCHTTHSDGTHSIAQMAAAAGAHGFGAITITDHSAAAGYANGLDGERLRGQAAEIAALADDATGGVRILHGSEADILEDGAIDVPPGLVAELDVVIASVHQRYKLDEAASTARLIAAMRQPFFKVWGHALGRLVLRREPIPVRLADVLDAVAESPAAIEINGDPHRLDLDPVSARQAVARGIKFVLSSDAHSTRGIGMVRYAVGMARRARIRRRDVLNTLPPDELAAAVRPLPRA